MASADKGQARAPVLHADPAAPVIVARTNPEINIDIRGAEPIVIEMRAVRTPTFVMPPDFNQRVSEITQLSLQLAPLHVKAT